MAAITANKKEANGYFPAVCMKCGKPATVATVKNLSWVPPWTGVLILAGALPYIIVVAILTKRATISNLHMRRLLRRRNGSTMLWMLQCGRLRKATHLS